MDLDESRRLEALRLFLNTESRLPVDKEDWGWIAEMAAYLSDGSVPKFEDDEGADLPAAENGQPAVQ